MLLVPGVFSGWGCVFPKGVTVPTHSWLRFMGMGFTKVLNELRAVRHSV